MTILFMDGFDAYGAASELTQARWNIYGGTADLAAGRIGGQSVALSNTGILVSNLFTAVNSGAVGFGYKFSGSTGSTVVDLRNTTNAATSHIYLFRENDRTLSIYDFNDNLLGQSTNVLSENVWHHISLEFTINDTTGAARLVVDGVEWLNLSAIDTRNGTPTTVGCVVFVNEPATAAYFDDVYTANLYVGDMRCALLAPNADVANANWNPSTGATFYNLLADTSDSTYAYSNTIGAVLGVGITDLPAGTTAIKAIQPIARMKKSDAGTRTARLNVVSNVTTDTGVTQGLTTDMQWFNGDLLSLNPDTGTAWSEATVNAVQLQIEVVA